MTDPNSLSETIATLRGLLERATAGEWTANLHHTQESAGRTYGFIHAGEAVPIAAVTLGVEGASQDRGRANAALIVAAINALPALLNALETREGEPVAWLRDAQPDAEDEALVVCWQGDPGAFPVFASHAIRWAK